MEGGVPLLLKFVANHTAHLHKTRRFRFSAVIDLEHMPSELSLDRTADLPFGYLEEHMLKRFFRRIPWEAIRVRP